MIAARSVSDGDLGVCVWRNSLDNSISPARRLSGVMGTGRWLRLSTIDKYEEIIGAHSG